MFVSLASKKINIFVRPADRPNAGFPPTLDPATGTLEMSPDLKLKARKAIARELRIIQIRLYFSLLFLQIEKLSLQMRSFRLRIFRNVAGYLSNLVPD